MAKLREAIYAVPPSGAAGVPCKVGATLAKLEDEDKTDLEEFLRSTISARRIAMALDQIGHRVSASLINEHRSKLCRCYKSQA